MLVDACLLVIIVSLMARENILDEWLMYLLSVATVVAGSIVLLLLLPEINVFVAWGLISFGMLPAALKFINGLTWQGAFAVAGVFFGIKVLLSFVLA